MAEVGDTVHCKFKIVGKTGEMTYEAEKANGCTITIQDSDIIHVEPRPFAVGDQVYIHNSGPTYTIHGINGKMAWIVANNHPDSTGFIQPLSELNGEP